MSYKIIWEEKGVSRILSNHFTNDDLLESNQEIDSDPRFSKAEYQLINLLEVEKFSIDIDVFHKLAAMDVKYYKGSPSFKMAVVAKQKTWVALTNVYKDDLESVNPEGSAWETQFFDNEEEARAWVAIKQ